MLTKREFEKLVAEGVKAIPERFLRIVENVAIVIEEEPTPEQREKMELHEDETLFGLYEGVPYGARGSGYTGVLPDKITIFRKPILEDARTPAEVAEIVRDTVWHEIAHHFGMEEHEVSRAEETRLSKREHGESS
jgi:predicted Zn-dependent protease with MMP-like domain